MRTSVINVSPLSASLATPAGRGRPPNRFSPAEPQTQTYPVIAVSANHLAVSRNLPEQRDTGSQTSANRLTPLLEQCHDCRQPCRLRHVERRLALVDPRGSSGSAPAQSRCSAVEENLHRIRVPLCDRHVERCVVVDATLIRICAERQKQPQDVVDIGPLVEPGVSRVQHSAAMRDGNPSSTAAFGSAPISRSVRMKASGL